ncbi:hypothetical protein VPHD148_0272 [Vibrio phage D148]
MTFATTAANRLNMQAPELSKFVVAFKDLSDELPENTGIQCGMFILDISGKYVYIPTIAKADNVQVLESMFDADSKTFIPITKKSVEWMIDKGHLLGKAERIPANVARDPDLYDAIVPPKTGKFVYASEGRIGGFFATLPEHIKKATVTLLDEDYELQEAMAKVMDIDVAKDHLLKETPKYEAPVGPKAPQVLTSAEGLSEEQVQDIMSKGYTVINPPKSKKIAVESNTSPYGALTRMGAAMPGTALMVLKKDGNWVGAASLKMTPKYTKDDATRDGNRHVGIEVDTGNVMITEEGEVLTDPRAVTCAKECNYDDVMTRLKSKRATEVGQGDYGFVFTGSQFYGPLTARRVTKANGWTCIDTDEHAIKIHSNIKTLLDVQGQTLMMSDAAMFYPAKGTCEPECDINMAEYKVNIETQKMLPYQSTLMHRDGVYAVDGKEIGGKPQIVEHLLREWEIDVPSVETFVKKADSQQNVIVKMAAVRQGGRPSPGSGTKVQQHYQHGLQPGSDDSQLTGNARQRAQGMSSKAKSVKDVADRETMEATIISEMLQNPDLSGSISEYLPDIKQAVDKLGRSLFLMRLNTNKLSDKIDAEALNNLFTSTRNAYRILGENYVELYNLVASEV